MTLGQRIREARRRAGLTQAQTAAALGVTRSACSQWETSAGTAPRRGHLAELADLLGVSYEWLATGRTASGVAEQAGGYAPGGLSPAERELVERFRRLSGPARAGLMALLRDL